MLTVLLLPATPAMTTTPRPCPPNRPRRWAAWLQSLRTATRRAASRPIRHLDAIGDPVADDPDDAELVAEQGGPSPLFMSHASPAEEVIEGRAAAGHAQGLETVAGDRAADAEGRGDPVEVDGLVPRGIGLEHGLDP